MALKDWKKFKGKDIWVNDKKDLRIGVEPIIWDSYHATYQFNIKSDKYMTVVSSTSYPLSVISRKGFKTKQQALKHARAYMRKH